MKSTNEQALRGLNVPPTESPFLEEFLRGAQLGPALEDAMRRFAEDGYLVFDLELPDFEATAAEVIAELAPHYAGDDRRVAEAWYFSQGVKQIAAHEAVLKMLSTLYQRRAIPFQTLNFDSGTQQAAHSDTLHFHCAPAHYMCGVWVALEDMDERNGPLFVYPKSHKLPVLTMADLGLDASPAAYTRYEELVAEYLAQSGMELRAICPKRGQAVLWAANLFHGGSAITEAGRTRHSQVTHYYFEDCLYYLPIASDPFTNRLCLREVIDIGTGEFVPHRYRGRETNLARARNVLQYPRPLPDGIRPDSDWLALPTKLVHGIDKTIEALRGKRTDNR